MAEEDVDQESKTEEPTAKRLDDARKKGNVARSQEIDNAFFLVLFLLILTAGGGYIIRGILRTIQYGLNNLETEITILNVQHIFIQYSLHYLVIILPIGLIFIFSGLLSMTLQTGFLISWEHIKPKFDIFKMDGLKQIFSMQGLKKLVIDLVKLTVLILIIWLVTRRFVYDILGLVNLDIVNIYLFLVRMIVRIVATLLIFYAFFAVVDYIWTKFQYTEKLKMTKSEVKDEFKQMEGDPQVRRKLLSLMMEESLKRMMKEVPTADVVITNPVHLAIAIKYDQAISDAPIVVAKGKRLVAERIKEIAREHDVPIIEDKPLAQLLYKQCKVGKGIDVQFYAAVAQILSQVYTMKNKRI